MDKFDNLHMFNCSVDTPLELELNLDSPGAIVDSKFEIDPVDDPLLASPLRDIEGSSILSDYVDADLSPNGFVTPPRPDSPVPISSQEMSFVNDDVVDDSLHLQIVDYDNVHVDLVDNSANAVIEDDIKAHVIMHDGTVTDEIELDKVSADMVQNDDIHMEQAEQGEVQAEPVEQVGISREHVEYGDVPVVLFKHHDVQMEPVEHSDIPPEPVEQCAIATESVKQEMNVTTLNVPFHSDDVPSDLLGHDGSPEKIHQHISASEEQIEYDDIPVEPMEYDVVSLMPVEHSVIPGGLQKFNTLPITAQIPFNVLHSSPLHLQSDPLRSYMNGDSVSPKNTVAFTPPNLVVPAESVIPPLSIPPSLSERSLGIYSPGGEFEPIEQTYRQFAHRRYKSIAPRVVHYQVVNSAPPIMLGPGVAPQRLDGLSSSSVGSSSSTNVSGGGGGGGVRRGVVGGISKPRRPKTKNTTPSRYCHICLRRADRIVTLACTNSMRGTCRKVICTKCFKDYNWDWKAAVLDKSWTCCHCRDKCPNRAQCFIYGRTNDRRHQALMQRKEEAEKRSKESSLTENNEENTAELG